MRKFIAYISISFLCTLAFAQVPGTWNEYFSFRNVQQLESVDDNVFALSENGIFIYNTSSQEIQKVTKLNGLSTIGLTCLAFCDSTSSFLIGYNDGTLDILDYPSLKVKAIPTIANKPLYGSKKINTIAMHNDTAVIATEFGILTFSMSSHKFISTTILSNDGSYVPAKSITTDGNDIYVATSKGIFSASIQNPNLSNYSSWTKLTGIPYANDTISHIAALNGTIYYAHKHTGDASKDSVFKIKNGTAEAFKTQFSGVRSLSTHFNSYLSITSTFSANAYDPVEKKIYFFDSETHKEIKFINDIIITPEKKVYICDNSHGLISTTDSLLKLFPQCPFNNTIADVQFANNILYVVEGGKDLWFYGYFNQKDSKNSWLGHINYDIKNSICVHKNPYNKKLYYGSFGNGLIESSTWWNYDSIYTQNNSLISNYAYGNNFDAIVDITSDINGNLWMINPGSNTPLVVKTNDDRWYSFEHPKGTGENLYSHILIDKRNYKWLVGGYHLTVFYENGTIDDTSDDLIVDIPLTDAEGTIARSTTCITEDLDGDIWVGTSQGIAVHSSPSRVFKDRQSISRIKIEIDGEVGYLLSSESITCIAVDGANRKWIGTENSGAFLISENGTEQLLNFTKNNSPLPSNAVTCISIDHATGEVYIGTELGLVSYIGDATAGDQAMDKVKIYPNPVRESYDGDIYIQGVVSDAILKITDVSGNLVRTITANGGTAVWDGRNTYGERVHTGVYLIYISDETATYTTVKKVLVIN